MAGLVPAISFSGPLLGLPGTGAGSGSALAAPGSGAARAAELAGAVGVLVALADADLHRAARCHSAGQVDRGFADIADLAVADPDAIAVGAVAGALLGDDGDLPGAVMGRGQGRNGDGEGGEQRRSKDNAHGLLLSGI